MYRFKKILSLLIVFSIIFSSGCSKQYEENEIVPMGRYVEEEIEIKKEVQEKGILKLIKNQEEEIEILVNQGNDIIKLNQDNTINYDEIELIHFEEEKKYIIDVVYGNDKNIYILCMYENEIKDKQKNKSDLEYHIFKSSDKKTFTEVNIPDLNKVNENGFKLYYLKSITVLENGNILLGTFQDEIYLYNAADGSRIRQYSGNTSGNVAGNLQIFTVYKNNLVVFNKEKTKLLFYDIETGDILKEIAIDQSEGDSCITFDSEGNLYIANRKGLYRIVSEGSQPEMIIDGSLTSMSMPSLYIYNLIKGNNNDYYIFYVSMDSQNKIIHYTYNENMPSVPNTELSIYSLWENKTIRQAIIEFQRENPEVKVNYRIAMTDRHAVTMPEHIKALNTELLNKKGADIIVLDKLVIDTYIEKGILTDMSSFLNPIIESGMLFNNIIEPYYSNKKIYAVPARFSVPVFIGKKDEISSIKTLADLADYAQKSEIPLLNEYTYSGRIEELFPYYSQEIINSSNEINKSELIKFLNNIKKINEVCNDKEEIPKGEFYNSDPSDPYLKKTKIALMDLNSFMYDLLIIISYLNSDSEAGIVPVNSGYIPSSVVGINSSSQKQELAQKFISVLLSEKVQNADLSDGFPVNKKSLENWTKTKKEISVAYSNQTGDMFTAEWPKEEELVKFTKILSEYDTPIKVDYTLEVMIIDEFITFARGEKSAEQAAEAIIQKAESYLSE